MTFHLTVPSAIKPLWEDSIVSLSKESLFVSHPLLSGTNIDKEICPKFFHTKKLSGSFKCVSLFFQLFDAALCLAAEVAGKSVSLQRLFPFWFYKKRSDWLLDMKAFLGLGS